MAEREAQVSQWDKVIVRGRSWADRAHKVTVYFLVTFSGTSCLRISRIPYSFHSISLSLQPYSQPRIHTVAAAAITAFALTDMILHNRRKRSAFYAEQRALYSTRLLDAIETEKAGLPLDEDQTLILNRERARVQAEEAKKERSWSVKGLFMGGLKEEEVVVGKSGEAEVVPSEGEMLEKIGVGGIEVLEAAEGKLEEGDIVGEVGEEERRREGGLLQTIKDKRREGEKAFEARGVAGGPLDQMAEEAAKEVKSRSSWLSWGR